MIIIIIIMSFFSVIFFQYLQLRELSTIFGHDTLK